MGDLGELVAVWLSLCETEVDRNFGVNYSHDDREVAEVALDFFLDADPANGKRGTRPRRGLGRFWKQNTRRSQLEHCEDVPLEFMWRIQSYETQRNEGVGGDFL